MAASVGKGRCHDLLHGVMADLADAVTLLEGGDERHLGEIRAGGKDVMLAGEQHPLDVGFLDDALQRFAQGLHGDRHRRCWASCSPCPLSMVTMAILPTGES